MQKRNMLSVQIPAPGLLLGVLSVWRIAGISVQGVPLESKHCFGTSSLDTGKQLRSLPKEFLP